MRLSSLQSDIDSLRATKENLDIAFLHKRVEQELKRVKRYKNLARQLIRENSELRYAFIAKTCNDVCTKAEQRKRVDAWKKIVSVVAQRARETESKKSSFATENFSDAGLDIQVPDTTPEDAALKWRNNEAPIAPSAQKSPFLRELTVPLVELTLQPSNSYVPSYPLSTSKLYEKGSDSSPDNFFSPKSDKNILPGTADPVEASFQLEEETLQKSCTPESGILHQASEKKVPSASILAFTSSAHKKLPPQASRDIPLKKLPTEVHRPTVRINLSPQFEKEKTNWSDGIQSREPILHSQGKEFDRAFRIERDEIQTAESQQVETKFTYSLSHNREYIRQMRQFQKLRDVLTAAINRASYTWHVNDVSRAMRLWREKTIIARRASLVQHTCTPLRSASLLEKTQILISRSGQKTPFLKQVFTPSAGFVLNSSCKDTPQNKLHPKLVANSASSRFGKEAFRESYTSLPTFTPKVPEKNAPNAHSNLPPTNSSHKKVLEQAARDISLRKLPTEVQHPTAHIGSASDEKTSCVRRIQLKPHASCLQAEKHEKTFPIGGIESQGDQAKYETSISNCREYVRQAQQAQKLCIILAAAINRESRIWHVNDTARALWIWREKTNNARKATMVQQNHNPVEEAVLRRQSTELLVSDSARKVSGVQEVLMPSAEFTLQSSDKVVPLYQSTTNRSRENSSDSSSARSFSYKSSGNIPNSISINTSLRFEEENFPLSHTSSPSPKVPVESISPEKLSSEVAHSIANIDTLLPLENAKTSRLESIQQKKLDQAKYGTSISKSHEYIKQAQQAQKLCIVLAAAVNRESRIWHVNDTARALWIWREKTSNARKATMVQQNHNPVEEAVLRRQSTELLVSDSARKVSGVQEVLMPSAEFTLQSSDKVVPIYRSTTNRSRENSSDSSSARSFSWKSSGNMQTSISIDTSSRFEEENFLLSYTPSLSPKVPEKNTLLKILPEAVRRSAAHIDSSLALEYGKTSRLESIRRKQLESRLQAEEYERALLIQGAQTQIGINHANQAKFGSSISNSHEYIKQAQQAQKLCIVLAAAINRESRIWHVNDTARALWIWREKTNNARKATMVQQNHNPVEEAVLRRQSTELLVSDSARKVSGVQEVLMPSAEFTLQSSDKVVPIYRSTTNRSHENSSDSSSARSFSYKSSGNIPTSISINAPPQFEEENFPLSHTSSPSPKVTEKNTSLERLSTEMQCSAALIDSSPLLENEEIRRLESILRKQLDSRLQTEEFERLLLMQDAQTQIAVNDAVYRSSMNNSREYTRLVRKSFGTVSPPTSVSIDAVPGFEEENFQILYTTSSLPKVSVESISQEKLPTEVQHTTAHIDFSLPLENEEIRRLESIQPQQLESRLQDEEYERAFLIQGAQTPIESNHADQAKNGSSISNSRKHARLARTSFGNVSPPISFSIDDLPGFEK